MPIFEYKCSCGLRHEHLVLPPNQPPATHTCPRCKEAATKLMGDSERRWLRDQVKQAAEEREAFIASCAGS
jgi:putative FmdB family regulatory protein